MWDELIMNLEAIALRSDITEMPKILEYAKSTKANSKELGFLLICFYAKLDDSDLELHSYFLNCFHTIGEHALEMKTFDKALDSVTK